MASLIALKRGGIFIGKFVEGGLGVDLLFANQTLDRFGQRRVFQDEQMRVKDAGVLGVERLADLALDFHDLLAGQNKGLGKSLDLIVQAVFGNVKMGMETSAFVNTSIFPWQIPADTPTPLYTLSAVCETSAIREQITPKTALARHFRKPRAEFTPLQQTSRS